MGSRASCVGALKAAAVPTPPALPGCPLPASVLTWRLEEMTLMAWLRVSATYVTPVLASWARPAGQ